MDAIGKIGLIVPEINSSLDHEFVNGVYEQAKAYIPGFLILSENCVLIHILQAWKISIR